MKTPRAIRKPRLGAGCPGPGEQSGYYACQGSSIPGQTDPSRLLSIHPVLTNGQTNFLGSTGKGNPRQSVSLPYSPCQRPRCLLVEALFVPCAARSAPLQGRSLAGSSTACPLVLSFCPFYSPPSSSVSDGAAGKSSRIVLNRRPQATTPTSPTRTFGVPLSVPSLQGAGGLPPCPEVLGEEHGVLVDVVAGVNLQGRFEIALYILVLAICILLN